MSGFEVDANRSIARATRPDGVRASDGGHVLLVGRDRLPDDPLARAERLRRAFPDQVAAAIASGAVGIASWFTPMLFAVPRLSVRHLRATARRRELAGRYRLAPVLVADPDLDPAARRPAVRPIAPGDPDPPGCVD